MSEKRSEPQDYLEQSGQIPRNNRPKTSKIINQTIDSYEQEVWGYLKEMKVPWAKFNREVLRDRIDQEEEDETGEGLSEMDADILLLLQYKANPTLGNRGFRYYAKKVLTHSSILNASAEELSHRCRTLRRKGLITGNPKA